MNIKIGSKISLLKSSQKSFTLVELLIVIGIIAVLLGMALVAINPGEQFAKANNVRRTHDLKQILSAIQQNMIDNKGFFVCAAGNLPPCTAPEIMSSTGYDICSCLVETYLPQVPVDPSEGMWSGSCADYDTQYEICSASLELRAPHVQAVGGETEQIIVSIPGEVIVKSGSTDTTPPVVGATSPLSANVNNPTTFSAQVSDNIEVTSCNLIVGGADQGQMGLSASPCPSCTASLSYNFTSSGVFPMYARCSDSAGNTTNGPSVDVQVSSPVVEHTVWQSCETGTLNSSTMLNYSMGYKFIPNINMTVTKLCGRWPSAVGGTRTLRLQNASFAELANAEVNSSGSWACTSITPSSLIQGGSTYYVSEYGTGYHSQGIVTLPRTCSNVSIESSCFQSGASGGFTSSATCTTANVYLYGLADITVAY